MGGDFHILARVDLLCIDLRILFTKGERRQLAGMLSRSSWTLQLLLVPAPLSAHSDSREPTSPDRALQDRAWIAWRRSDRNSDSDRR